MTQGETDRSDKSAEERALLAALVSDVRVGLLARVEADGALVDACQNATTPRDHYAPVFLALALHSSCERDVATEVLDHWASIPAKHRGHEPFNRLGLGLMAQMEDTEHHSAVAGRHEHCPLRSRYPSNNWGLLAQALRVREAESPRRLAWERRRLRAQVRRWTTHEGGFIDFPRRPNAERGIATPVAYHLKYLLCLHLALGRGPDPELERALIRGLDWLRLFLTDAGYCGGFGRSNHALFGDACLLTVLHGLLQRPGALRPDAAQEVLRVARNIRQRLERQRRDDGLLWLTPGGGCGEAAGWDGYMFLSVYNAWFAGLLSTTLNGHPWLTGTSLPDWTPAWNPEQGIHEDREAGLLRFRGERVDAQISTRGQAVQGFGRSMVDLRQAAVCPFHLEVDGRPVVAPPARISAESLKKHPERAGGTPIVESAGALFGMTRLDAVTMEAVDAGVVLTGSGSPVRLTRAPERTFGDRLRATLDWRLLGGHLGRQQGVRPPTLPGHQWAARLEIDDSEGTLRYLLRLHPPPCEPDSRWLNAAGSRRLLQDSASVGAPSLSALGPAATHADPPASWPRQGITRQWEIRLVEPDSGSPEQA
ncbi:hypothetical protein [Thioalkalivibrio sp. ALJT]|uniref:hypothetical protein n=1 Tax=Thioalkalivibrio sp. ALJT TaxID=1158146 RepID=UPI001E322CE0|nr:hypothetical protein [Thioalkalivibrio sp. ALJT]